VLPVFTHASGWQPNSSLALDPAGNLYGTTLYGGRAEDGVTYKLSHQSNGSWKYRELHEFVGTPAENPHGVILDKAGNLFGSTNCSQGNNCAGLVYEITP
jgi:uncharacterized repeat protein (TIGR03803 family)